MNRIKIVGFSLLCGLSGAVAADCNSTALTQSELEGLLPGKTVCASYNGDQWQEFHSGTSGGANNLIDYKKGKDHPVDPSEPVGSWSIGTDGKVTYDYGSGGKYSYTVHSNGGDSYSFCGDSPAPALINATLVGGNNGCGLQNP